MAKSDVVPPRGQRQKPVVIVIDDDETVLLSLRVALASTYMVRTYSNPIAGVTAVRDLVPDIVLLDVRMPERDGFWVFREIRAFNAGVPIIFNSAYQDMMDQRDAHDIFKPFAYLPKNGRLDDLLNVFARALAPITARKA